MKYIVVGFLFALSIPSFASSVFVSLLECQNDLKVTTFVSTVNAKEMIVRTEGIRCLPKDNKACPLKIDAKTLLDLRTEFDETVNLAPGESKDYKGKNYTCV